MRKPFYVIVSMIVILSIITISCDTKVQETEEPAKIENTLQSVSYFQDTVGIDPTVLFKAFTLMNEAIDEIGYPDAGYKLWMRPSDTSDVRFMVEGLWPDQAAYDLIHNHQLYIDAMTANATAMDGLVNVKYYRFEKAK
jgi:hypothetical protein